MKRFPFFASGLTKRKDSKMPGVNLSALLPYRIQQILFKALGEKQPGLGTNRPFFEKAGVPATNTAADDTGQVFAWCYDTTNLHFYVCSAWTNSTTFTWTQVT